MTVPICIQSGNLLVPKRARTHWLQNDAILSLNLKGDVDISQSCTRLEESTDPWFSVIEVHVWKWLLNLVSKISPLPQISHHAKSLNLSGLVSWYYSSDTGNFSLSFIRKWNIKWSLHLAILFYIRKTVCVKFGLVTETVDQPVQL